MSVPQDTAAAVAAVVTLVAIPDLPAAADLMLLSPDEHARAARFMRTADHSAFITARAALRRLLAPELGIAADRITFQLDARGRPYIGAARSEALDFNVSHSGALAAVAVARGRLIGVDVESHSRPRGLRELVPEVMGVGEAHMLQELDGDEFTRAFHACWTRKEAIVKALGIGIGYPLRSIDVPIVRDGERALVDTAENERWSVFTREPLPGYTLSVALAGESARIEIDASALAASVAPLPNEWRADPK